MHRKTVLCAVASAAMITTAAAFAHPGGGAGGPPAGVGAGGPPAGVGGGMGNAGGPGYGSMNNPGVDVRDEARTNSQGPDHASPTGVANANQNSVLAGTTSTSRVTSGPLAGLTPGMTLYSNGTAVGTVQQIRTVGNGSVALVIVKGTNGALYAVPASKLSLVGGMLSTTSRLNGINNSAAPASNPAIGKSQGPLHASPTGIAHASPHSVLAGASGATLSNISTGMAVLNSTGTQVGTVTRVFTNQSGMITKLQVRGTNGRLYTYSASAFSLVNGQLTTTAPIG